MFLIARRQVDVGRTNQELMYMSLKFINNIWVLTEMKVAPGSTTLGVRLSLQLPSYPKLVIIIMFAVFPCPACSEDIGHGCDSWSSGGILVLSSITRLLEKLMLLVISVVQRVLSKI